MIKLGKGLLFWMSSERKTERYGSVVLTSGSEEIADYEFDDNDLVPSGKFGSPKAGKLTAKVLYVREGIGATHDPELQAAIQGASQPVQGEEIVLGEGPLLIWPGEDEDESRIYNIGIYKPRESWPCLDVAALRRLFACCVELWFEEVNTCSSPSATASASKPFE